MKLTPLLALSAGLAAATLGSAQDRATDPKTTPGTATPGTVTPGTVTPGRVTGGTATGGTATGGTATGGTVTPGRVTPGTTTVKDAHGHDAGARGAGVLDQVTELIAVIRPLGDSKVSGTIRFQKNGDKVKITAEVSGLNANADHAFHVHEFGNAGSDDGNSAGGHYNPEGHPHGLPDKDERHAGDFGNLSADGEGKAKKEFTVNNLTLAGAKNPIVGRSVIIHAKPDDGGQPTGNAGDRIGIGVIGVSKAEGGKD